MKREWLLLVAIVSLTLSISLGLIRWLAPGLLGYAVDQQLVRVSAAVPSFYENIFRPEDNASDDFILRDPYVVARAKPFFPDMLSMGPNDLLGFRNRYVPNKAEIVVIGDSQTYGNNATLEFNWPSHLQKAIYESQKGQVYNLSVGAWGAINYSRILDAALKLRPRLVVVAFYTGNDPISDFRNTYGIDDLAYLIPDDSLSALDLPVVEFPPPEHDILPVTFSDGIETAFTPEYRFYSNDRRDPVVTAGYKIIAQVAREMAFKISEQGVEAVFTVIPTKELVYAAKVAEEGIEVSEVYDRLVIDEKKNIDELAEFLESIPNAKYVDVIDPLQRAALLSRPLYPSNMNGHPISRGYKVIAGAIAESLDRESLQMPSGLVVLKYSESHFEFALIKDDGYWTVASEVLEENGWNPRDATFHNSDLVSGIRYLGYVKEVNPDLYGPESN